MQKRKRKLITLIILVILTFILGFWLEIDYRILTRRTVKYFANYQLGFYGKEFRIFETDVALILTLIPIGFFFTTRKTETVKKIIGMNLVFLLSIITFYCFYCYLESHFIKLTVTNPIMNDGILEYHLNNLNYRTILILTIISTFISGMIIKKIINGKKPVANKDV